MNTRIEENGASTISPKLFSKKQAAAELGVSYRTIERWFNNNYIDYVRIGGRVFICYSEIYRIRDQFIGSIPSGHYLESRIQTIDDIRRRQDSLYYGASR